MRLIDRLLCVLCACVAVLCGARPSPAQDEPKLAGTDVPAPKRVKTVQPVYPADAQARGIRGIVLLELLIDAAGKVARIDVVRSIPGLDEAAVTAARQWEYEVTKLDGKPVSVRLTVPITFAMPLPALSRQEGIPELRSGAVPRVPAESDARGGASVTVEVTLDPDGSVAEARLLAGEDPWSRYLLQALRTWRFEASPDGAILSFRVQADFVPAARGAHERVDLRLTGLRRSETLAADAGSQAAPEAQASPSPSTGEAGATPSSSSPEPAPAPATPAAGPPEEAPSPASPAAPALAASTPDATPREAPAPPASPTAPAPPPPPTEVLSAPPPREAPARPAPEEGGPSAVPDVTLEPGVPELTGGRRPVVPPLARMAGVAGTVEVRFAVDAAGTPTVLAAEGPELLKPAAESAVGTWAFRRVTAERLLLKAVFTYSGNAASAVVSPVAEAPVN